MKKIKPYSNILFEATSHCNARCTYCPTGRANLFKKDFKKQFLSPDLFERSIRYMLDNHIIDSNTVVSFFNKGEPLLNKDLPEIIKIANKHPRVNILQPGPGVGGHCISVDPWFLVGDYPGLTNIILTARKINDSMPEFVLERIHGIMKEHNIRDSSKVGLYGLTYKENVDDTRESPALQILECMEKHLATGIKVYDPFVNKKIVENQYFNFDTFINSIELLVILVAHDEIKENMGKIRKLIIFDTKNVCKYKNVYRL